jgi:MYXO-CTERM domain-containing protein
VTPGRRRTTATARIRLSRLAVVVGLLAATGAGTLAGPAVGTATAADTICVALLVDFADLGAGVDSDCVTVPDGSSGEDVLRARHTLGFRPNQPGFVCTIDGWPQEGCGASNGDHYWAYFHRAPGASAWTYSTAGAASYEPRNNSTEGWVWLTRRDQTPANVAFSAICTATSSPRPQTKTSSPAPGGGDGGNSDGRVATPPPPSDDDGAAGATTTDETQPSEKPSRKSDRKRDADAEKRRSATPSAAPTTYELPDDDTPPRVLTAAPDGDDGSPPYGLLIGAVAVAGLGGAAVLRSRRNRDTS